MESTDGAFATVRVKSMRHDAPGGRKTGGPKGMSKTIPVAGSTTVIVNNLPAQAVPAAPVPVGLRVNTPGSGMAQPVGPLRPQLGTRVIVLRVTPPSGGLEEFWI